MGAIAHLRNKSGAARVLEVRWLQVDILSTYEYYHVNTMHPKRACICIQVFMMFSRTFKKKQTHFDVSARMSIHKFFSGLLL